MKKDIKLKNELANLYTELLEAKEAESDDRKKQKCFEGGTESEKGLGNKGGVVQNEVNAAAQPMTCDDREIMESENERDGRYGGAKEDARESNNKVDDTVMILPSITCESNKMKEELIMATMSPTPG